ncbi:toll/interleukin-1 receptor domain-containing protein [Mucilaginibacter celer]|uniref:TIR domain-containing protein n=1 Tax=Mucilaginibacter celer TaxID=2305508 RepID=A0A494VY25_9SPHI|nr:toll/interleukin-1 receptor domain-containing protein [Mucilaginibacter celer]AYL96218.1 hypothetical protein HYN43_013355 [Mucilaginibacter celer]
MKYDAFICFAPEDKEGIALPIADGLKKIGYEIRPDEFLSEDNEAIRIKIENGLKDSHFGIIILSEVFMQMISSKSDLDTFLIRQNVSGEKILLPVWHNVTPGIIEKYSVSLTDRVYAITNIGLDSVIASLASVMLSPINIASSGSERRHEIQKIMTKPKYTMNLYNEWHSDLIRESRIAVSAWVRRLENNQKEMPNLSDLRNERDIIVNHIDRLLIYYDQWAIFAKEEKIDNDLILKLLSSYLAWYYKIFILPLSLANQTDNEFTHRLNIIKNEVFTNQMFKYNSLQFD